MTEIKKNPIQSILSKKRYNEIKEICKIIIEDEDKINKLLKSICEIMKYNPDIGLYDKTRLKELSDKRKKEAEEKGISVYESLGLNKYYEKNKDRLNKKRSELYKKKKEELKKN
jgi:hypothetical protein